MIERLHLRNFLKVSGTYYNLSYCEIDYINPPYVGSSKNDKLGIT